MYIVMSREQTAGLSHIMKADNSSTERMEGFKEFFLPLGAESFVFQFAIHKFKDQDI